MTSRVQSPYQPSERACGCALWLWLWRDGTVRERARGAGVEQGNVSL